MSVAFRRQIGRVVFLLSVFSSFLYFYQHQSTAQTGQLVVYTSVSEDHAIKAMEVFGKETGIHVSYVRLSAGETLDRLRKERDRPVASIWYGGPSDTYVQAKSEDLLTPYISQNAKMIPAAYKDEEGYWTGVYLGSIAFASNRHWLNQVGLPPPSSWHDLLAPEYKEKVMMADPRTSGTAYTTIATLAQLWGEDQAIAYLKALHTNIRHYPSMGRVPGRSAGMGEVGTSIIFSHDAIKYYNEGFRDLIISFPVEGTGYEIGAVAIVKNGPNLKEAMTFVDWALTKQAQEIGKQTGNYQLLTNEQAVPPADALPLDQLQVIPYDSQWAGLNRQHLLDRWTREVLNQAEE